MVKCFQLPFLFIVLLYPLSVRHPNYSIMDRIPEDLRETLASHGYIIRDDLPNVCDAMLWRDIRENCGFSIPQMNNVTNALFPVECKSYYIFARFLLYFLQVVMLVELVVEAKVGFYAGISY